MTLIEASKEAIWLKELANEFGISQGTVVNVEGMGETARQEVADPMTGFCSSSDSKARSSGSSQTQAKKNTRSSGNLILE
ncbi:unnamed protein product [Prunus armeniaca]